MATYTPLTLLGPAAWTAAVNYSAPAATNGIIRTISVVTTSTAQTFDISLGASAAGTVIFNKQALTASVTSIYNGWWVSPSNTASSVSAIGTSASVVGTVSGYSAT